MKKQRLPGQVRENHRPIEIHIDELILHGFDPRERHRIAASMQHELAWLIRSEGAPVATGITPPAAQLDAGVIEIRPGSTAHTAGARIAAAVYRGLRKQDRHAVNEASPQPNLGDHRQ